MAVYTTIDNPELYFQTVLYSGNSTARDITLDGDENMQPDLVWIKERDDAINHYLTDSVRGAPKKLTSNTTSAESAGDSSWINAFNSDGFSVGNEDNINDTGDTYVAWCWKESATAGFDIVAYTGNGSNRTISHSLSAVPKVVIVKYRSSTGAWITGHAGIDTTFNEYISLNTTSAKLSDDNVFNDTAPTSSVFSLGTDSQTNQSSGTYIAYLWTSVQGFSAIGSYKGNGNANGTFVYTGFRPAFILVKPTSADGSWNIYDNKRLGYNDDNNQLYADLTNAEGTDDAALLSNGFKWTANTGDPNSSGRTYIYMAFAEAPFVNSNEVPCNAR